MSTQVDRPHHTPSPKPAGSRRARLDLARFSLDLGWARGLSDSARSEAYPSPPMSGSPSHPARHKNDFDDRGYGGFGGPLHPRAQIGGGSSQQEEREGLRGENAASYASNAQMGQYAMYQPGGNVPVDQAHYNYPPQPPVLNQQRPLPPYQFSNNVQPLNTFAPERASNNAPSEPAPAAAPKSQRKTKGHVASACLPCKRAHLRCDANRPCSRCVTGGKEDQCNDMPHKKRGRPRLRDDRENRFDANLYTRGPELLRRPISMFPGVASHEMHSDPLMRSSYRVLKSQTGPSQAAARFMDHASIADANIYPSAQRQLVPQDIPCAYLNMDFQIIKATKAFCDAVGFQSLVPRKLQEIVAPNERDKIENLREELEAQRQRREPQQYLPPPYGKVGEDRVIQSVGFGVDDVRRIPMDGHGVVNFQGPNGEHRPFEVKLGLAKRDTTFFVSMKLAPPPQHQMAPQQQYPISNFGRDQQYGFQQSFQPAYTPQQFQQYQYQPPMQVQPQTPHHTYDEPRVQDQSMLYRPMMTATTPIQQSIPLTTSILNSELSASAYSRPSSASTIFRPETGYSQSQQQYTTQAPMSLSLDLQQARPQTAESGIQLPPIRNQGSPAVLTNSGMSSVSAPTSASVFREGAERTARLDIGGLLEKPATQRRLSRG